MVVLSALYRVIPYDMRPEWLGSPQLALALFAGSVVSARKWAFALPMASLFLSDVLMQVLYVNELSAFPGFYQGQLLNYGFIALLVVIGFFVNHRKPAQILSGIIATPTLFFLLSNFAVWVSGGGYNRAKTIRGLLHCYADGLPFYGFSLVSMAIYSIVLFAGYHLYSLNVSAKKVTA
jgi:hypothetical protein